MREIIIKTVHREKGFHEVRLGNGTVFRFTSQKAARKFLADTNRFLTEIFFNLNQSLVELYEHSRQVWVISTDTGYPQFKEKIDTLEHLLQFAYLRASWESGNYFAFINLKKGCEHSKVLIKFLLSIRNVSQTDTVRRHRLNSLFDQVNGYQMRLMNYGQAQAFDLFSTTKLEEKADSVNDYASEKTILKIA